ncbi:diguanylate cyclase [Microbacterium sp. NPDC057659]|uniref:GGDEF domain-containing protein n=1 Tax=Microbacterium sp. NPDC057659 TaxID=3346198 RepID=UPI00366BD4EE
MVVQDIRAEDAEELRWLRFAWLKSARERTSTYAVVTSALLLYFGLLGVFELFENDLTLFEQLLSAGTTLVCIAVFLIVVAFGISLPQWVGIVMVIAQALVSVYYLGFSDERQNAIAALQELPVMAMYFSWFYPARTVRIVMLVILVCGGAAAVYGPFIGDDGLFGPVNLIGAALFSWMCLEAGIFMRHRVRLESYSDELTGALNRRGFLAKTQMEMRRAKRRGIPLSVAVLDLDKFKAVNDEAGHAAGDYILRSVSSQWMSLSRSTDIVGRLGGDEFAMLLPDTDAQQARSLMLRLREYASHPWSWGIAQLESADTVDSVLARADRAMYRDKRG